VKAAPGSIYTQSGINTHRNITPPNIHRHLLSERPVACYSSNTASPQHQDDMSRLQQELPVSPAVSGRTTPPVPLAKVDPLVDLDEPATALHAPPNLCNLYVRNVAPPVTGDEFCQLFEAFGTVLSHKLMVDIKTGTPRGFGFILYREPDEARRAIAELNGFALYGQALKVDIASGDVRTPGEPTKRLFLRHLPATTTEKDVVRLCHPVDVASVVLHADGGDLAALAHVTTKSVDDARSIARRLNNSTEFLPSDPPSKSTDAMTTPATALPPASVKQVAITPDIAKPAPGKAYRPLQAKVLTVGQHFPEPRPPPKPAPVFQTPTQPVKLLSGQRRHPGTPPPVLPGAPSYVTVHVGGRPSERSAERGSTPMPNPAPFAAPGDPRGNSLVPQSVQHGAGLVPFHGLPQARASPFGVTHFSPPGTFAPPGVPPGPPPFASVPPPWQQQFQYGDLSPGTPPLYVVLPAPQFHHQLQQQLHYHPQQPHHPLAALPHHLHTRQPQAPNPHLASFPHPSLQLRQADPPSAAGRTLPSANPTEAHRAATGVPPAHHGS
jgi:hypothetical protein